MLKIERNLNIANVGGAVREYVGKNRGLLVLIGLFFLALCILLLLLLHLKIFNENIEFGQTTPRIYKYSLEVSDERSKQRKEVANKCMDVANRYEEVTANHQASSQSDIVLSDIISNDPLCEIGVQFSDVGKQFLEIEKHFSEVEWHFEQVVRRCTDFAQTYSYDTLDIDESCISEEPYLSCTYPKYLDPDKRSIRYRVTWYLSVESSHDEDITCNVIVAQWLPPEPSDLEVRVSWMLLVAVALVFLLILSMLGYAWFKGCAERSVP